MFLLKDQRCICLFFVQSSNIIFTALQFTTHSRVFSSRCLRWTLSSYGRKEQPLSERSFSFCTVYMLCWLALQSSKAPECAYTNKPRQIPVKQAQPIFSETASVLHIALPPCFIKSEFLCTPFKLSQYFVRPLVFLFLILLISHHILFFLSDYWRCRESRLW
jgi:hypothetical protein